METKLILIVEGEKSMCEMLEVAFRKWGYRTKIVHTMKDGVAALERGKLDGVLTDIKLPDGTGIELLNRFKTLPEKPPVVLMTAFGNTDDAVKAIKMGAFYYITKPFKLEELRLLMERALQDGSLKKENETLRTEIKKEFSIDSILGRAPAMKDLFAMIERVAKTKTNILITGESGTGKELVARAIHYTGTFKNKPFVAVNCGAIPENLIESELFGHKRGSFTGAVSDKDGLFQVADGGSIFLDEIGELPMPMQVKLLRVLQDRSIRPVGGNENTKIDVRVISATNRNLEEAIKKNQFREDLYYRLNVINIKTPSLRNRKEDISELVDFFIKKFSLGMGKSIEGISPEAMNLLMQYEFPGNVRELENMMERAVALEGSGEVQVESLPPSLQKQVSFATPLSTSKEENFLKPAHAPPTNELINKKLGQAESLDQHSPEKTASKSQCEDAASALEKGSVNLEEIVGKLEKEYILAALEKSSGVKKKAAYLLGITFRSMRYRIAKYGIDDAEGDSDE